MTRVGVGVGVGVGRSCPRTAIVVNVARGAPASEGAGDRACIGRFL